jgi:adenosylcobinamide-GDP ribazoletransferase
MTLQERLEAYRQRLRKFFGDLGERRLGGRRLGDLGPGDLGLDRIEPGALLGDLRNAMAFYTRIPLTGPAVDGPALARAAWCAPLVGALIGALAGLAFWIAWRLNLPPFLCATLAVGVGLALTGCLHEDGLADMADGFGGGGDSRERTLGIMRDSRIGAFGACALAIALLLRVGALADLPNPGLAAWALIGAHAAARAALPLFMRLVPPARPDGLSAAAGAPSGGRVAVALAIGLALLLRALGLRNTLIAIVLMLVAGTIVAAMARRRIGGQTGDVLGAVEQVGECLVLLVTAARF